MYIHYTFILHLNFMIIVNNFNIFKNNNIKIIRDLINKHQLYVHYQYDFH